MQIGNIYQQRFEGEPLIVRSPGRINLIGEHTDYNDGFVLPAAIDLQVSLALCPNGTPRTCRLFAADIDQYYETELDQLGPRMEPGWVNYLLGVAGILQSEGHDLRGFDLAFQSTIPLGAGLSSSAAIECATALALNEAFDLDQPRERLLRYAQQAEHHYAGVLCGIMDQFASMMGKDGHAILLDCRTLDHTYVPIELGSYELILCDSGVKHSLAASAYNTRREECEEAVNRLRRAYPEIQALRDLSLSMLEAEADLLSPELLQRARHVVTENQRVLTAREALAAENMAEVGDLLYDSHQSLQYDYEVSCPELDLMVDTTRPWEYVAGARIMGGGFGGCSLNLVESGSRTLFEEGMQAAYREAFGKELRIYPVAVTRGTYLVS